MKERLWCLIRDGLLLSDPTVAIVDSMPIPVCQFARAYRCHRFDDTASFGKDHTCRQTDLRLWLAHAFVLARSDYPDVLGSRQCA